MTVAACLQQRIKSCVISAGHFQKYMFLYFVFTEINGVCLFLMYLQHPGITGSFGIEVFPLKSPFAPADNLQGFFHPVSFKSASNQIDRRYNSAGHGILHHMGKGNIPFPHVFRQSAQTYFFHFRNFRPGLFT